MPVCVGNVHEYGDAQRHRHHRVVEQVQLDLLDDQLSQGGRRFATEEARAGERLVQELCVFCVVPQLHG